MRKIIIYPAFDAFYYSFYLHGIFDVFGRSNVDFSCRGFPSLSSDRLAFVVKNESRDLRVIIDAYDGAALRNAEAQSALRWSDVYGKVNLLSEIVAKDDLTKCVPIGPSFPVQIWSPFRAWEVALRTYRRNGIGVTREHFANYRRQYKYRLPLGHFVPGLARDDYIFFSSTIWREEEAPATNQYRASFMDVCKSLNSVTFEGGFSPRSEDFAKRYQTHFATKRYPLPEWLEKIKASAVAFYAPAVWLSHTFKLAEFLALGKAIISTPISRDLPAPLVHGEHVHYVDGSAGEIRDAVLRLLNNREYRQHLEQNAYRYYLANLTPRRVIQRLLEHPQTTGNIAAEFSTELEPGAIDSPAGLTGSV